MKEEENGGLEKEYHVKNTESGEMIEELKQCHKS